MMDASEQTLYREHVGELQRRYEDILAQTGFNGLIIGAGVGAPVWRDDQQLPFRANPYLLQWAPLTAHPDSLLSFRPGEDPELVLYQPEDFWHQHAPVPALLDNGLFQIRIVDKGKDLYRYVESMPRKTAFVGEIREREDSFGLKKVNPERLLNQLDYQRSRKTPWEIHCIAEANRIAVKGHEAAAECFAAGGSEYEIQLVFRAACQATDNELPYPPIVATNQNAATLHYQHLDRRSDAAKSLLIDAGYSHHGYASDVTRSHSEDASFGALIEAMDEIQRHLCDAALPGTDFRELHMAAHHAIAGLLQESDIVSCKPEEAVASGLSHVFFPHGLGHFLGLQVHDAGALLASADGGEVERPENDPSLRLTRCLEPNHVLTIEPGLYFIDSLLEPLRHSENAASLNWSAIDELKLFGGIRIEDNIVINESGNRNLTREGFSTTVRT
jgi:Xaa-Pro dipeptidase